MSKTDAFPTRNLQAAHATTNSGVKTVAAALPANGARQSFFIQNLSTSPLTVQGVNANNATITLAVLSACTAAADGTGGSYYDDEYTGAVTASGTGLNYIVVEI